MDIRIPGLEYRLYNTFRPPFIRALFQGGNPLIVDNLITKHLKETKPLLLYFPAERLNGRFFKDNTDKRNSQVSGDTPKDIPPFGFYPEVLNFAFRNPAENLDHFLKTIEDYRTNKLFYLNELAKLKSQQVPNPGKIQEMEQEYNQWQANYPDPVKALADEFLDEILLNVGLKVKTELDRPSIRNLEYIQLQTLSGQDVSGEFWSTGTHHLVMSALPLFLLKPQNAVILVDEPERSLYPDMQTMLIPFYSRAAGNSQFFFATHSPIVASAFEPWEIIKLNFDREHREIKIEPMYEGENTIENYRSHPEYLRWDLILQDIFKLEEEGGEKRIAALNKFAELNVRLRYLKTNKQLDTPEGQKLINEARELGDKLHWRTDLNQFK